MNKKVKRPYKTIPELQELSKQFSTPELLCNYVLEYSLKNDKIMNKLINKYIELYPENSNSNTLYFDVFNEYIKTPRMIKEYYKKDIFTESKINKSLILEHGRNYPDGFSGIKVKRMSYTNDYIIEIVDGENGQQFVKAYRQLPTQDQLIYDSVFPDILYNDGCKPYKPSIMDFYSSK